MATVAFEYVVEWRHRVNKVTDAMLGAGVYAGGSLEPVTSVWTVVLVGE